jgi:hypothetical protein
MNYAIVTLEKELLKLNKRSDYWRKLKDLTEAKIYYEANEARKIQVSKAIQVLYTTT